MNQPESVMSLPLGDVEFSVIEALPMGVAIYAITGTDTGFCVAAVNTAATVLFEVPLTGSADQRPISSLHSGHEVALVDGLESARQTGEAISMTLQLRASDSCEQRWVATRLISLDTTRIMAVYTDVSPAMHRAQRALRRMSRVFSDAREAIVFVGDDGCIEEANRAAADLLGYSNEQLVDRDISTLLGRPCDPLAVRQVRAALVAEGHWYGELWAKHCDGHDIPGLLTVSRVREETGEPGGYTLIFRDISDIKANEEKLYRLANEDSLTGLPNRSQLMRALDRNIQLSNRSGTPFSVMFIDLDRFKDINDSLGHAAGDKLLKLATARLRIVLRANDLLARVGGDEFVALAPGLDSTGNASIVAEKIIDVLAKPFDIDGRPARVGASVGIASYPDDATGAEELLRNADTAMYQAKADGRGSWRCYSDEMTQRAARHLFLVSGLRQAIAADEGLRIVYQPQYDLESNALSGFEALLRWQHPDAGAISPDEFIPAAKESALIRTLDIWVVDRVCSDLANSGVDNLAELRIAINIGGKSLASEHFARELEKSLRQYRVPGSCIELEVSQGALLTELDTDALCLDWLGELGVGLSLDGFGTSYSSLLELKRLPIRRLKIDGEFVRDLPMASDGAAVVSAIVAIGRTLELEVVAEGVETSDQAACLAAHGGIKAQGYLYSQPIEVTELSLVDR